MSSRERNLIVVMAGLVVFVIVLAVLRFTVLQPSAQQPVASEPTAETYATATFSPDSVAQAIPTVDPALAPNDPQFPRQWYLAAIHAPQAWANLPAAAPVVVAVLDSGVCLDNPDLAGRLVPGTDYIGETSHRALVPEGVTDRIMPADDVISPMEDAFDHGCAMASVIAAITNNEIGIAGIAANVMIMPVKVLDGTGQGVVDNVAQGIRWAVDNGAGIINLSLTLNPGASEDEIAAITNAVNYAAEHNVKVVASAGNTYGGQARLPATMDSVISVGALTEGLQPTDISAAIGVDVWAPGEAILAPSIYTELDYKEFEGASIAAAIVTGVLAATGSVPTQQINGLPVVMMAQ